MNRWTVPPFLAGVVVGWIFLPTPLAVCGAYRSDALPAWVQAIGSVAAIVAAVVLVWWQQRAQRREAFDAMSKRLFVAKRRLWASFSTLATSANQIEAKWRVANATPETLHSLNRIEIIEDARHEGTLVGDHAIREYEGLFHELDVETAKAATQALNKVDQYNELLARLFVADRRDILEIFPRIGGSLEVCAQEITRYALDAYRLMQLADERTERGLHGGPRPYDRVAP